MAELNTITDPNLPEPKGVASQTAGKVYVSNGAGSGAWTTAATAAVNATTSVRGIVLQAAADTDLTDSTGGTPSGTLASFVGTTWSTDSPTVKNTISSLAAEIADLKAKMRTAGILA
jgi:hypothetical protein